VKNNAFVFSTDAILALLVLLSFSFVFLENTNYDAGIPDLIVLQKENDLLKVWCKQGTLGLDEMASDFSFVFPNAGGKVSLNGTEITVGRGDFRQSVSSSAKCFYPSKGFADLSVTFFG